MTSASVKGQGRGKSGYTYNPEGFLILFWIKNDQRSKFTFPRLRLDKLSVHTLNAGRPPTGGVQRRPFSPGTVPGSLSF